MHAIVSNIHNGYFKGCVCVFGMIVWEIVG